MDGSRAGINQRLLERVPRLTKEGRRSAGTEVLKVSWAAALAIGWPLALAITQALQPAPTHPEANPPVAVQFIVTIMLWTVMGTVWAAMGRLSRAGIGGVIAGVAFFADTLACPLTGHHQFGVWWVGQMAASGAILAVSAASLGRWARTSESA